MITFYYYKKNKLFSFCSGELHVGLGIFHRDSKGREKRNGKETDQEAIILDALSLVQMFIDRICLLNLLLSGHIF